MKKIFKYFSVSIYLIVGLVLPALVSAASASQASKNLEIVGQAGSGAPYQPFNEGANDLATIVGVVIQAFLSILGVLFLTYMVYAGYNWLIAQGDEEKVTKAKATIQRAIIGLIITLGAYAISNWVFGSLLFGTNILSGGNIAN